MTTEHEATGRDIEAEKRPDLRVGCVPFGTGWLRASSTYISTKTAQRRKCLLSCFVARLSARKWSSDTRFGGPKMVPRTNERTNKRAGWLAGETAERSQQKRKWKVKVGELEAGASFERTLQTAELPPEARRHSGEPWKFKAANWIEFAV